LNHEGHKEHEGKDNKGKNKKNCKEKSQERQKPVDQRIKEESIATQIVDSAIKVHKALGPGLLESAYQACLKHELTHRSIDVCCEVPVPIGYDGIQIDAGYRLDMLVGGCVIVENKAIEQLLPIHEAQLLTYLKLMNLRLGFLINWNEILIKYGIKRLVQGY
jgi:GxxExxY protein